ncbi:protein DBF4 homolog B isoform X1 [Balearica regulorum gibbericeps]|uniref:protein DBF4 homolog B isoform X1 n=1 Tax=Balearica regulorum gibbericeps TaxID=100784 RepID=UPI003F5D6F7C
MAGPAAPRPLRGKSFYLDLPSGRSARELAEAIRRLGGVTESFLSKEVSYVVSSSKEAKRDKARTQTEKWSNVTSEDAKATSPVPSTSKGNHTRPHQKPPDTALISRGKELLQKAMKNQDTCSGSSILANARLWGVQILHMDEMLSYAQQLLRAISGARKRCQKTEAKCLPSGSKIHKAGKLKPPFLKVEDQSRQFRPFHHQFKSFPDLNFLAPKTSSPFEPLKSLSNSCRARGAEGCPMRSDGEKSPRSTPVTVPKKKRGFCECCQETFEELQKHLQSPQHTRFALDDSQYAPVDRVISQLTNNFVEQSAKAPPSCLTDERLVPQARVTGGIEMLTAELGKEKEQPGQGAVELLIDAEHDHGLKTKGCSPCLPRAGVSNPRAGGLSKSCCLGLPAGAGLPRASCAACGTTEEPAVGDARLGWVPSLGWGTCVAAACVGEAVTTSSEPQNQQMHGSAGHLPQALPASKKRQLSSRHSAQVGKKPRLERGGGLSPCRQTDPVGGGMGAQGAGQVLEPGLPGVVEAGSLPRSTELSTRPRSSPGLDPHPRGSPGDPASQPRSLEAASVGFDPAEAAAASAVGERGWRRANVSSQGKQLGGENENAPGNVSSPDLESTVSTTSCPTGRLPSPKLPVAEARCCCSLCVRAAEKIAPELPDLAGHSREWAPCPGLLQPLPHNAPADHEFSESSESDWDVQLLSTLTGVQDGRVQSVDRDLLQRTHVNVRDSGYESQLCSVLKQKSELPWAGKEDKNCRNCCTETKGASFPVFETFFGSWTS